MAVFYTLADQARHNGVSRSYMHKILTQSKGNHSFPEPDDEIGPRKTRVWKRLYKIKGRSK